MSSNDADSDIQFQQRMSRLIGQMKAKGVTPYGTETCVYTKQRMQLSMAAVALRDKGHIETADYMDAEMNRIQDAPGLESDMLVYVQALADQIRLCFDVWNYCEGRDDLADVTVHLAFGWGGPTGTD